MTVVVELSDGNQRKLAELASRTGKSTDQLVNEAVEKLPQPQNVASLDRDWKDSWMQAVGMWKDRVDLPDFEEIRRSMDRDFGAD